MNDNYIAGFFDGEGSAMVLTIRREEETDVLFRFRPVVRIVQNDKTILEQMQKHLGFGHVTLSSKGTYLYVCNGHDNVEQFVRRIMPLAPMKGRILSLLQELIDFQRSHTRNIPYSKDDIITQLRIRDDVFELNSQNRKNLTQKYPAQVVMREHRFVDLDVWQNERVKHGIRALNEYAKSRKIRRVMRLCACGCGGFLATPDKKCRPRRFIHGHNNRKIAEVIIT